MTQTQTQKQIRIVGGGTARRPVARTQTVAADWPGPAATVLAGMPAWGGQAAPAMPAQSLTPFFNQALNVGAW